LNLKGDKYNGKEFSANTKCVKLFTIIHFQKKSYHITEKKSPADAELFTLKNL